MHQSHFKVCPSQMLHFNQTACYHHIKNLLCILTILKKRSENHEALTDGTNITNISLDHTFAIRESPKELKRKLDALNIHKFFQKELKLLIKESDDFKRKFLLCVK